VETTLLVTIELKNATAKSAFGKSSRASEGAGAGMEPGNCWMGDERINDEEFDRQLYWKVGCGNYVRPGDRHCGCTEAGGGDAGADRRSHWGVCMYCDVSGMFPGDADRIRGIQRRGAGDADQCVAEPREKVFVARG